MLKNNKRLKKSLRYLTLVGVLLILYGHFESRWIKIKRIEICSSDLPPAFDGKVLAFVSDIHHGPLFSIERVNNMVDQINALEPDMVLLGGDYVYTSPKYIAPVFNAFGNFHSKLGTYVVLGNHEYRQGARLAREMMRENGLHNCDNRSYWVRLGEDSIKIGGVSDISSSWPRIDSTLVGLGEDDFCILLSHNPDFIRRIRTQKIDLMLSGHTHGGQITIFGLLAIQTSSRFGEAFRYGMKKVGNIQFYITSGIGTIIVPIRFFCRPEIVLFTLKKS